MNPVAIRPVERVDIPDALRLLGELNPDTPKLVVKERLEAIQNEHAHYQLFGAYDGDELVGVCSAWVATKIWCGKYLEIDNMVVRDDQRSRGVGTQLMKHMEQLGKEQGCKVLVLDSYTSNHASHRLYQRMGFEIWGFHFIKPVGDWEGRQIAV